MLRKIAQVQTLAHTIPKVKVKTMRQVRTDRQKLESDRNKIIDGALSILFILSIVIVVWGINIYRKTIIDPKYLFAVVSIGTVIAAVILFFVTKNFLNAFFTLFIAAAIGGGTTYFLTLYLNKELAVKEISSETFDIKTTGNLGSRKGGCRSPYAVIDFYGNEKQLVFYCEYEKSIHDYKIVKVDFFRGFFGFPVVETQTLIR